MSLSPKAQAALDKLAPAIKAAFEEAIAHMQSVAQVKMLEAAIEEGNLDKAAAILKVDPTFFAPLDRAITEAFWRGGVTALAGLPQLRDPFPGCAWQSVSMAVIHALKTGQDDTSET